MRHFILGLFLFLTIGCGNSRYLGPVVSPAASQNLPTLCSFNVQFLGSSRVRKNEDLAKFVAQSGCDLVAVQELVAHPSENDRADKFFAAMAAVGFDAYILSEQDTGTSEKNFSQGTNTEWWVTFYKSSKLQPAKDLPHGFLDGDVTKNPIFDRVPYAFAFRTLDGRFDFVIISVHLHPAPSTAGKMRRQVEMRGIFDWIQAASRISTERDYIILGDFNFQSTAEANSILQGTGFVSLNAEGKTTNTNVNSPKPYDHFLIDPKTTSEIETQNNFDVLDLLEAMAFFQDISLADAAVSPKSFKGDSYNHNLFRLLYSDHHPIRTRVTVAESDDD